MRRIVIGALLLFVGAGAAYPQASPFSNSVFPAQSFTAAGQTGSTIQLNGLVVSSTVGSSFASGSITLTGSSLTTVTFSVMGSSDNGATFYALPLQALATPGTFSTSVTATANGIWQVNLAGLTHIKFVTSGTFTATSVTLTLTASPNAMLSRAGGGGGSGTVSTVSVATANGFQGSVANPTTTPAISVSVDSSHVLPVTTGAATTYLNGAGAYTTPAVNKVIIPVSATGCAQGADLTSGNTFGTTTPATDAGPCLSSYLTAHATPGVMLVLQQDGASAISSITGPHGGGWGIIGSSPNGIASVAATCSVTSNVATCTNTGANNLVAGEAVMLSGYSDSTINHLTANTTYNISATGLSATGFQFPITHADGSLGSGYASVIHGNGFYVLAGSNPAHIISNITGAQVADGSTGQPGPIGGGIEISHLAINGNRGVAVGGVCNGASNGPDCREVGTNWIGAILLDDVSGITLDDDTFFNIPTYAVNLSDDQHVTITNSRFQAVLDSEPDPTSFTNQDGIHVDGNVSYITARGNYFRTGDDSIALNAPEGYSGPISHVAISDSFSNVSYTMFRAYTNSIATQEVSDVSINAFNGSAYYRVCNFGNVATTFPDVESIKNFRWSNSNLTSEGQFCLIEDSVGLVEFSNDTALTANTTQGLFIFNTGATDIAPAQNFILNGLTINRTTAYPGPAALVQSYQPGTIGYLQVNNLKTARSSGASGLGKIPQVLNLGGATVSAYVDTNNDLSDFTADPLSGVTNWRPGTLDPNNSFVASGIKTGPVATSYDSTATAHFSSTGVHTAELQNTGTANSRTAFTLTGNYGGTYGAMWEFGTDYGNNGTKDMYFYNYATGKASLDILPTDEADFAGTVKAPAILPGVLYSAAGTALPTCAAGIKGQLAVVSDATAPTYMGAYTSGGAITAAVICSFNGSAYSWLTH